MIKRIWNFFTNIISGIWYGTARMRKTITDRHAELFFRNLKEEEEKNKEEMEE